MIPISKNNFLILTSGTILSFTNNANAESAIDFYKNGNKKRKKGNNRGAITDYTKAIEIDPKYINAYFNRAISRENIGDLKGAVLDYSKVVELDPKDVDAYYNRAILKEDIGDLKGAVLDYTKVVELDPEDGDAFSNRALLKEKLGDFEGAVSDQNKAFEFDSKDKIQLFVKDIVAPKMLKNSLPDMRKGFNKITKFDGKTYQKPITYYIHDKTGKTKAKLLPAKMKYAYEISDDVEKFIVETFNKIDNYIALDFKRVNSPEEALIKIYKTKSTQDSSGMMSDELKNSKYNIEIAWSESEKVNPKVKDFPTLSSDSAYTIVHEIGHALGLEHQDSGCGKICKSNIDPNDKRINSKDTVMSYNNFLYPGEDSFFSELDINALKTIWGPE